jgi:succinyl-CoA synthetase beta subunit
MKKEINISVNIAIGVTKQNSSLETAIAALKTITHNNTITINGEGINEEKRIEISSMIKKLENMMIDYSSISEYLNEKLS